MTEIFVGNLPNNISQDDIKPLFEWYGRISSINLFKERGKNNCHAIVKMAVVGEAKKAIKGLNELILFGSTLDVYAIAKIPKPKFVNNSISEEGVVESTGKTSTSPEI